MGMKLKLHDEEIELLEQSLDWLIANANDKSNRRIFHRIYEKIQREKEAQENNDVISYMFGASESALELYNSFMVEYDKDLYHSLTAVIEGYKKRHSEEMVTEENIESYYIKKYKGKRPMILEYKEGLTDMISHVFSRLSWK